MSKSPELEYFLHPRCVRERSALVFELIKRGESAWSLKEERLEPCADYVVGVIREKYPDLKIPFHSRRGHLRSGGVDRVAQLKQALKNSSPIEQSIAEYDLIITSVFLDAGAGDQWSYRSQDGTSYARSEGLAVASYDFFASGAMHSKRSGFMVDAEGLKKLSPKTLADAFQASCENPLLGVAERCELMNRLGDCLEAHPEIFAFEGTLRPGNLFAHLSRSESLEGQAVSAVKILQAVLKGFDLMWPPRTEIDGMRFGDLWEYSKLPSSDPHKGLIAFHKLSQWLSYSLMEPLIDAGASITEIDELTGLPEYRNGGLLVDLGVLTLKQAELEKSHRVDSDVIIEWRAATVCLLDAIAKKVRKKLGVSQEDFPLVKILEGGTWHAGRKAAQEFRGTSLSPITLESDGTVF